MRVSLMVDVQNDFMFSDGALYVPNAEKILTSITKLNQSAELVIATRDYHTEKDAEFKCNGGDFDFHCMENTWGAEIVDGLKVDILCNKTTYDIGNEDYFEELFKSIVLDNGIAVVDVYGVVSTICVAKAVESVLKINDKYNLGLEILIHSNAIAGLDESDHNKQLDEWRLNNILIV